MNLVLRIFLFLINTKTIIVLVELDIKKSIYQIIYYDRTNDGINIKLIYDCYC